jgi:hypothetical protein
MERRAPRSGFGERGNYVGSELKALKPLSELIGDFLGLERFVRAGSLAL